jgi:hypothetical protein
MSSTFGPCSLLDLPAEIRIGIYKYLLCAGGFVKMHWSILGTSCREVLVNLVFRFRVLKKKFQPRSSGLVHNSKLRPDHYSIKETSFLRDLHAT